MDHGVLGASLCRVYHRPTDGRHYCVLALTFNIARSPASLIGYLHRSLLNVSHN